MDIYIPPKPLSLDAQHNDLQLRYAGLQQEYQSVLIQHETLLSKSNAQCDTISHLENRNAEIKGLLEKYTAEFQQLNDTYYCVMQEHKSCQKLKEQLQDLANRWKAQVEKNTELTSICTKLRRELEKDPENQTPDKQLPSVEEVQAPVAVEATTMSDMEYSDDESVLDDLQLYTWRAESVNLYQYKIFLAYAATKECELQGYGFNISQSIEEAIPQITNALRQAKTAFSSKQLHAITILGMHLSNTEPAYLFGYLEESRTIFIGSKSVLAAFLPALTAEASSSQPNHSVVPINQAATQALEEESTRKGKRKRGEATREITAKRRRATGAEVAPSTLSTRAKKRKPLGILKSKKFRSSKRAAATDTTSTAAE